MAPSWRAASGHLPITPHLQAILNGVRAHSVTILEASPGSGKSTVFPLALMDASWLAGKRVIALQPRRIAARSVAERMAHLLGEVVGNRVGFHVRFDRRVSSETSVEVITEGILTRKLIADPSLPDVGAIIFDEFHERSTHLDIGLALSLEVLSTIRPDLKIIIMSATLGESLPPDLIKDSWRYTFEGTPYPVKIVYSPPLPRTATWERVVECVKSAVLHYQGDILAFLPGSYDIRRAQESLELARVSPAIYPLYGALPFEEQERAIKPDPLGRRKIVLATTIAETSITIDGVSVVVDSGYHNVARADVNGADSLATEPISRDAADQRAGRAGRTGPGICLRLWSEHEHNARRPFREPEILRSDLAATLLDLAAWGASDFAAFSWITPPNKAAVELALKLLRALGALTDQDKITETGRLLCGIGTHPRLAALAVESRKMGLERTAAKVIAILEERDTLSKKPDGASFVERMARLSKNDRVRSDSGRVLDASKGWLERLLNLPKLSGGNGPPIRAPAEEDGLAVLIAKAYPEFIAQRREPGSNRYLLASGKGAALRLGDPLAQFELLAVAQLKEGERDLSIQLAAPLPESMLYEHLSHLIEERREVSVNENTGSVESIRVKALGAITLTSHRERSLPPEALSEAFTTWLSSDVGFATITWTPEAVKLRRRARWATASGANKNFPDLSDAALKLTVEHWLIPSLPNPLSAKSLSPSLVESALAAHLSWGERKELDRVAPRSLTLPSGRVREINYPLDGAPYLEAKIQELFGVLETPTIGDPLVPLTIHLLSPAGRPVQVTNDLKSFWRTGYPMVRKELRGRYPKHKWPEDPLETSAAKR